MGGMLLRSESDLLGMLQWKNVENLEKVIFFEGLSELSDISVRFNKSTLNSIMFSGDEEYIIASSNYYIRGY